MTSPVDGTIYKASTVPSTFSGSVADNSGGAGLNSNSTTFTLQNPSGQYWTGSAWQSGAYNLATSHSSTTSGTSVSWSDNVSLPSWSSQSDGVYTVQATATDKVGNTYTGPAISFTLDRTAPTTTVTSPVGGSAYKAAAVPATFSGSVADNTGGSGLAANSTTFTLQRPSDSYYWTGSAWQSGSFNLATTHSAASDGTAVTWTSSVTLPTWSSLSDGTYTVKVTATDTVGNSATGTAVTFILDKTAPATASVSSPSNGTTYGPATMPATFSGSAADSGSSGAGLAANSTTFTLKNPSGLYWSGSAWQSSAVNLATTSTATSGSSSTTWTSSATLPAWASETDGSYTVQATATDKAGNSYTGSAISFTLDASPPTTASVTSPVGSTTYRASTVPSTFSGSAADNSGGAGLNSDSTTFTLQRASDGYYWTGSAWQAAVSHLATSHSSTTSGTSVSWSDNVSLPSWSSQSDGVYTVQATATDKVGNTYAGPAISFTLDRTAPATASVISPVNGTTYRASTMPATFSGSAADNSSGSGLAANSTTFTLTRSSDGHYWTGSAWQYSSFNLATTHSATSDGDSVTWTSAATLPAWSQGDGTYSVQVTATDKVGNTYTGSAVSFGYDSTAPVTASVTSPVGGTIYRAGTVPAFSGSVADNSSGSGLAANSATFTLTNPSGQYWNGSGWQSGSFALAATNTATSGSTSVTWTSSATLPTWSSQADGSYTVQATATDKAGNSYSGSAVSFTLDNTAPTVTVNQAAGQGDPTNTKSIQFTVVFSESVTGVATGDFTKSGTATGFSVSSVSGSGTTYTVTVSGSSVTDGTVTLTMPAGGAADTAGNTNVASTSTDNSVTYEATAPTTASVTSPVNGTAYRAETMPATFSGSAADNTGGVGLAANSTTFTLQRASDSYYWTGSAWQAAVANLATTHATTTSNTAATWTSSATLPNWVLQSDGTYTVKATATDKAGNTYSGSAISFTFHSPAGPSYAGTGADNTGVGTATWTNPGNITAADTNYATCSLGSSAVSHYLWATNFGFGIPAGATINGIQVSVMRESSSSSTSNNIQDNVVSLIKGGAVTGSNKATATYWPDSMTAASYGGTGDSGESPHGPLLTSMRPTSASLSR